LARRTALGVVAAVVTTGTPWAFAAPAVDSPQSVVDTNPRPLGPAARAEQIRPVTQAQHTDQVAQPGATTSFLSNPIIRTGGSLAIVLSVIFVLAFVVRKVSLRRASGASLSAALGPGGPSPAGLLEILGRYPVARGQSLVLLRLDRRVLLLSQTHARGLRTPGSFTLLCEVTEPQDVASILVRAQESEQSSLASRFRGLLKTHEHAHVEFGVESEQAAGIGTAQHREIQTSDEGDRVELWPDAPTAIPFIPPLAASAGSRSEKASPITVEPDSIGSLRRRLDLMRTAAPVGGTA